MAANPPSGPKKSFDAFGIGGVLIGLLAIGVAFIIEGGDLSSLVLPSPFIIVFGVAKALTNYGAGRLSDT